MISRPVAGVISLLTLLSIPAAAFCETSSSAASAAVSHLDGALPRIITAGGDATIIVPPDAARITLTVEAAGQSATEASANLQKKIDGATQALQRSGGTGTSLQTRAKHLSGINTKNGAVGPQTPVRTEATLLAEVQDTAKVGAVVDAFIGAGASSILETTYFVRNMDQARAAAIQEATRSALGQAKLFAASAGVKLGELISAESSEDMDNGSADAEKGEEDPSAPGVSNAADKRLRIFVVLRYEISHE